MNDGACDPQGRLWAGTLADDFAFGGGALYRPDGNGRVELILGDLTISNGLGWSPDGGTMISSTAARGWSTRSVSTPKGAPSRMAGCWSRSEKMSVPRMA